MKKFFKLLVLFSTFLLTVLMAFIISFYLQLILYFAIFSGPNPYEALDKGEVFMRGIIHEKNDQMVVLEKKNCNVEECKLLGSQAMKLQRSPADEPFQVGDTVIVQLGPYTSLENPPKLSIEPSNLDKRLYAVQSMTPNKFDPAGIDRSNIASLIMLGVCVVSVVGAIYWWWGLILTKKKSAR